MKARAQLQEVAEALAAQAHEAVHREDGSVTQVGAVTFDSAANLVQGAKAALEAAALIDAEPAPLIAAMEKLTAQLGMVDLDMVMEVEGPAAAIEQTAEVLAHYMREVKIGAAVQHGYAALTDLLMGLLRDFSAGDTDTSRRIAARIKNGLESATEAIEAAQRQEGTG